jgi:hypothetical protein
MKQMGWPRGCCDERDETVDMARYLVTSAFRESLGKYGNERAAYILMGIARQVALDLMHERGMSERRSRELVNGCCDLLSDMTEQMELSLGRGGKA